MKVTHIESHVLEDGSIEVEMEIKKAETDERIGKYKATGEHLLGAIGNCMGKMLDHEIGEIKNERVFGNATKGPFNVDQVTMRIIAEHDGKEKEIVNTGDGIMETIVGALKRLAYR